MKEHLEDWFRFMQWNPWIMDFPHKKVKVWRKLLFKKASTFHHVFRIFPSLRIKERSIFEVRSWILSYYKFLHMIEGAWPGHRVEETATARRHRALSGYNQNWINNKFLNLFLLAFLIAVSKVLSKGINVGSKTFGNPIFQKFLLN